ncbi:hypothetical protein BHM03_00013948 [Ensete ventricosum]|nr:hypothetical protein BHM03_00013948 [Ensete ventricosum]
MKREASAIGHRRNSREREWDRSSKEEVAGGATRGDEVAGGPDDAKEINVNLVLVLIQHGDSGFMRGSNFLRDFKESSARGQRWVAGVLGYKGHLAPKVPLSTMNHGYNLPWVASKVLAVRLPLVVAMAESLF